MEFRELDDSWASHNFAFIYTTTHHYRVSMTHDEKGATIALKREALPQPITKSFDSQLFSDWLENPWVLGVFEGDELIAFIETSDESWNKRLRIANLWVKEEFRRQGIGKILIDKAIQKAVKAEQRALVLETQSCNDPAIQFYRGCGFELVGLDATHYSNDDIAYGEVRLEFGYSLWSYRSRDQLG